VIHVCCLSGFRCRLGVLVNQAKIGHVMDP
jgi:hypothetical protein